MIEIVRDAATIAAVQRNHGGTNGAFRNDALFEWLKSKCPLQEIVSNMGNIDRTQSQVFYKIWTQRNMLYYITNEKAHSIQAFSFNVLNVAVKCVHVAKQQAGSLQLVQLPTVKH